MFPSRLLSFVAALAVFAATPAAQDAPKPLGTLFKSEVDAAIDALRKASADASSFGDGSCLQTAMVLTAMGHCHRFYSLSDGPVTRNGIKSLFAKRQADGSFGSDESSRADATAWAVEALEVMEPEEYRTDIAQARAWLAQNDAGGDAPSPWRQRVAAVLDVYARGDGDPKSIGAEVAAGLAAARTAKDWPQVVEGLTRLVACQAAARQIDAGTTQAQAAADAWTPAQQKGLEFLLRQQEGGEFFVDTPGGKFPDTGLSALGLAALLTKPPVLRSDAESAVIDAGLQRLLAQQNDDGSFAERNANYTTCAAMLALARTGREELKPALERAQRYILGIQNVEARGYARSDRDYGSIGYGGDQRGDVSNLQFAMEALRASGLDANHEAFAKALVFLQRSQNLRSVNDFSGRVREEGEWIEVTSGDDGGSAYYPGNSAAGYIDLPDGKKIPRSYGSMTYALLKTYTLAGVDGEDPRVRAAVRWIERNWTLDENPGADPRLPEKTRYQGLFYYYMVLAQALDEAGVAALRVPANDGDGDGVVEVRWREILRGHLASLQSDDGSWVNSKNGRWWEDGPALCTIYALLAFDRAD